MIFFCFRVDVLITGNRGGYKRGGGGGALITGILRYLTTISVCYWNFSAHIHVPIFRLLY